MRSTKIICTLGPATFGAENLLKLARGGMDVARINLSHGETAQHRATIRSVKELNERLLKERGIPSSVGILLDTQGPEIRTGDVAEKIPVAAGEEVLFSYKDVDDARTVIRVNHEHFAKDVVHAERILVDNGELAFEFKEVRKDGSVVAIAKEEGLIGSRRHVNLPGANLTMPSIIDRDWEGIALGAEEGVDYIALSFVREAKDIHEVRDFLKERGASIQLIAKIETRQAVKNLHELVEACDGVMVARGDLGAELPYESLPSVQDEIVATSKKAGKTVIVATQMLESMIEQPMPTRAEVVDIAHAATTRVDATMLSGETASGEHPFEALEAMAKVLVATEQNLGRSNRMELHAMKGEREARAHAAVTLATTTGAVGLVVITKSGKTAKELARFRPALPIIAFTDKGSVQRSLQLTFGTLPLLTELSDDPEQTVLSALREIKRLSLLKEGSTIVLVSDSLAHKNTVNTIQIRTLS